MYKVENITQMQKGDKILIGIHNDELYLISSASDLFTTQKCYVSGLKYKAEPEKTNIHQVFNEMEVYSFDSLSEFCEWYLSQVNKGKELIKDHPTKLQEFLEKAKIEVSYATPVKPTVRRKDKLAEVIQYFNYIKRMDDNLANLIQNHQCDKDIVKQLQEQMAKDQQEFDDWLNEEVEA